jgi:hypothetical protein
MSERHHRPSLVGPLILIAAGILLLLNQTGRLPWSIWGTLWRFWPVILILVGLEVLIGASRSIAWYIVGLVIAVVVLAGIIGYAVYRGNQPSAPRPAVQTETVIEATQDADRGKITLKLGVGTLEVQGLADSPNFVEGTIEYGKYSLQAERSFRVRDGQAQFSLLGRSEPNTIWAPGNNVGERWNLKFTPRIPLEMDVTAGVGSADIDLRELQVVQLEVSGGVGQTKVLFPAGAGLTKATVSSGVGEIIVEIPQDVGAKIKVSKGLTGVNVSSSRFTHSGDEYVSANYATAENKLDLEVKSGIGAITIQ